MGTNHRLGQKIIFIFLFSHLYLYFLFLFLIMCVSVSRIRYGIMEWIKFKGIPEDHRVQFPAPHPYLKLNHVTKSISQMFLEL